MALITISHENRRVLVDKPKNIADLLRLAKEIFKPASDDVHLAIDFIDPRGSQALVELHESSYSILKDGDATFLIANNKKNDGNEHYDAAQALCSLKISPEAEREVEQEAEKTLDDAYNIDEEAIYEWHRILEAKEKEREARQKENLACEEDSKTDEADYDPYTGEEDYDSGKDKVFYKWGNVLKRAPKCGLYNPETEEEELEEAAGIEDQLDHEDVQKILEPLFADAEAQETFRRCCALFARW